MDPDRVIKTGVSLLVGVVLLGVGWWARGREAERAARSVETTGTVVSVERRSFEDDDRKRVEHFAPVVEFSFDGGVVRFTGQYERWQPATGVTVPVQFDPRDASASARVPEAGGALGLWAAMLLGAASLLVGLRGLVSLLRGPRA